MNVTYIRHGYLMHVTWVSHNMSYGHHMHVTCTTWTLIMAITNMFAWPSHECHIDITCMSTDWLINIKNTIVFQASCPAQTATLKSLLLLNHVGIEGVVCLFHSNNTSFYVTIQHLMLKVCCTQFLVARLQWSYR